MQTFSSDPLTNAVQQGMKPGIDATIEKQCYGSAVILMYSAMDMMAHLGMPSHKKEVQRGDFINWACRYVKFKSKEKVTGVELYAARCATLHTYGVKARDTERGKARHIIYSWGTEADVDVKHDPRVAPDLVAVSIPALRNALFEGIDRFLVDIFSDPARKPVAEKRVKWLLTTVPIDK